MEKFLFYINFFAYSFLHYKGTHTHTTHQRRPQAWMTCAHCPTHVQRSPSRCACIRNRRCSSGVRLGPIRCHLAWVGTLQDILLALAQIFSSASGICTTHPICGQTQSRFGQSALASDMRMQALAESGQVWCAELHCTALCCSVLQQHPGAIECAAAAAAAAAAACSSSLELGP
jgi:hypothetical protein